MPLKSIKTKSFKFLMISFFLHAALLVLIANGRLSLEKPNLEESPLNSYIIFKARMLPGLKPESKSVVSEDEIDKVAIIEQPVPKLDSIAENKTQTTDSENTVTPTEITGVKKAENFPDSMAVEPTLDLQRKTTLFFENANEHAVEKLAGRSLNNYRQPKPIIDASKLSTIEQIQKDLNESFAPPGTDITVISQAADETLILNSGRCFRVVETALDDTIYRGASVWNLAQGCGIVDKFDGQLKISLDKYLKK